MRGYWQWLFVGAFVLFAAPFTPSVSKNVAPVNAPPQLPPLHKGMCMYKVNEMLAEPLSIDQIDGGCFAVYCQGSERIGYRITTVTYGGEFG
jgi:hypothetical protein